MSTWAERLGFLLIFLLTPGLAAAQIDDPCNPDLTRGPIEVNPGSGAGGVTLDAPVKLIYSEGYFDDPGAIVSVELFDADAQPVPGSIQIYGDVLFFLPDALFEPASSYQGTAYGLDRDLAFNFFTGSDVDSAPPSLGPIVGMDSTAASEGCDAPDGGFRIDVRFPPAVDDGAPGSIEYLVYLVRGPTVDAPELRARARHINTDLFTMAFILTPEEATSTICVEVHAVDGVGNVTIGSEIGCIEPVQGKFFEAICDVGGAPGVDGAPGAALCLALASLVLLVRRRRI